MPAYHTTQVQQMPSVGNMGVLALRGNTKGPAPQIQEEDIIGNSPGPYLEPHLIESGPT